MAGRLRVRGAGPLSGRVMSEPGPLPCVPLDVAGLSRSVS